ncbi:hypothetical protein M433DRAFT_339649 [Acidomyces richmondensis BFW]|nr:hypothetical protein M433DRAFT_339649 [Acidomyces richmondensis BFW]
MGWGGLCSPSSDIGGIMTDDIFDTSARLCIVNTTEGYSVKSRENGPTFKSGCSINGREQRCASEIFCSRKTCRKSESQYRSKYHLYSQCTVAVKPLFFFKQNYLKRSRSRNSFERSTRLGDM